MVSDLCEAGNMETFRTAISAGHIGLEWRITNGTRAIFSFLLGLHSGRSLCTWMFLWYTEGVAEQIERNDVKAAHKLVAVSSARKAKAQISLLLVVGLR